MATAYAHTVRHRTLRLPWDFHWRFSTKSCAYSQCPASGVAFQLLQPTNQWPEEAYSFASKCSYVSYRTSSGGGLCYFCKSLVTYRGLHFDCAECQHLPKSFSYQQVFNYALSFANQSWPITTQTHSQDWMTSYSIAAVRAEQLAVIGAAQNLSLSQKLKLSAQIRLTKHTGD